MILTDRFHYLGGNVSADDRALELRFALTEADPVLAAGPDLLARVSGTLAGLGLAPAEPALEGRPYGAEWAGQVLAWAIRALLQGANHPVASVTVNLDRDGGRLCVVMVADDVDTDVQAAGLGMGLLNQALAGCITIRQEFADYIVVPSREAVATFLEQGRARAMCAETLAIVAAARRLEVPVISLDRDPYPGSTGALRIRDNGILMLGHCKHRRILDGSVYVDADPTAARLTHEPALRGRLLGQLPVPLASRPPAGPRHRAYLQIGGQHVASLIRSGDAWVLADERPNAMLEQLAARIAGWAKAAAILVEVEADGLAAPPGSPAGARAIVDFSVAPRLDDLLASDRGRLAAAAEALVRWAFPAQGGGRVPSVAVTGTNGKSTTSLMIHSILSSDGRSPGAAWTGGVLIGQQQVQGGDLAGFPGHLRLFESTELDAVVLETARGGIVSSGFGYDRCDVAVCTNVAADHIGLDGIETVEEMARIKAMVVARARHAAVLNADDPFCDLVLESVRAENLTVVSSRCSLEALRQRFGRARAYGIVAGTPGDERIELHEGAERACAVSLAEIPVTLGGRVRFNVENAMQAMAASHFLGARPEAIAQGLAGFRSGQGAYVGRATLHQGRRFTVVVDMAHNVPGLKRFQEFAAVLPCKGRRIVLIGFPPDRTDYQAREMSRVVRDFYDEFVIRPSGKKGAIAAGAMRLAEVCHAELRLLGVASEKLHLRDDILGAVDFALDLAEPGDLLAIHMTSALLEETWQRVSEYPDNPPA